MTYIADSAGGATTIRRAGIERSGIQMIRWLLVTALMIVSLLPFASGVDAESSRRRPIPFGEPEMVGGWAIRVRQVDFDAAADVMAENQFNDPPEPGFRFVLARVEGTYLGAETGSLAWDLSLRVVGNAAVAYGQSDPGCGVVPDDLFNVPEAFTGGEVSGNACWAVPEADINSIVLFAEPTFSFDDEREFFALSPPGASRAEIVNAGPGSAASASQIAAAQEAAGPDTRKGGRDNPIPPRRKAMVGNWTINVLEVNFDATNMVMAENQFNDPPAPGHVFVMARIRATLGPTDEEPATFWTGARLRVVGDANVAYSESEPGCGVVPRQLTDQPEVFQGGTITGNACWSVPAAEVDSLLMLAEPAFNFDDTPPLFFALN
jgi:hypothetical protein